MVSDGQLCYGWSVMVSQLCYGWSVLVRDDRVWLRMVSYG